MRRFSCIWSSICLIFAVALGYSSGPISLAQTVPPPTRAAYLPLVLHVLPTETPAPTPTVKPTPPPTATSDPGQGDIKPPQLVIWSFSPTVVNVSQANQTITFVAHFTDDLSGLGGATQARFRSPSNHQLEDVVFAHHNLISGTFQDGIYRSTLILPRFSESGTWELEHLLIEDAVGNSVWLRQTQLDSLGLPTSFQVTNQ